jgi:hypothetical protein
VDAQIPVAENEGASSGLLEAALEISRKRTQMMEQMRKALETGDEKQALSLARLLVGLSQTPVLMAVISTLPVVLV